MPAPRPTPPPAPVRWRPRAVPLAALVTAAFLALTGFLGYRAAVGEDPALGAGTKPAVTRTGAPSGGAGDAGAVTDGAGGAAAGADGDATAGDGDGSGSGDAAAGEDPARGQSAPANPSTGTSG